VQLGGIASVGLLLLGLQREWGLVSGFLSWLSEKLSSIDDFRSEKKVVRREDLHDLEHDVQGLQASVEDLEEQLDHEQARRKKAEDVLMNVARTICGHPQLGNDPKLRRDLGELEEAHVEEFQNLDEEQGKDVRDDASEG
jgi:predicted  nucleic acid-binding Zn-ribbon protein